MSESYKNFIYNKFTFTDSEKNKLKISNHKNILLNHNAITPCDGTLDLFQIILDNNSYLNFKNKFCDFSKQIYKVIFYDFYISSTMQPQSRIFVLTKDFKLFEFIKSTNTFTDLQISFTNNPKIITYDNILYFFNNDDTLIYIEEEGDAVTLLNSCNIKSFTTYKNMIYFTDSKYPYTLFFTFDYGLKSLSNKYNFYGSINFRPEDGIILKVVYFKNKLYVIQQFKISACSSITDNLYFYQSSAINGLIIDNTITLINDNIIFMTTSGLFVFDGNDINQIFDDETKNINLNSNLKALSYNNSYFLKCAPYDNTQNILIKFDLNNNSTCNFTDFDIDDIYLIKNKDNYHFCLTCNNGNFILNKKSKSKAIKYFEVLNLDFDLSKTKQINSLKIVGHGDFNIIISSDMQNKKFYISLNRNYQNINIKGNIFSLKFESNNNFEINSIIFNINEIGE